MVTVAGVVVALVVAMVAMAMVAVAVAVSATMRVAGAMMAVVVMVVSVFDDGGGSGVYARAFVCLCVRVVYLDTYPYGNLRRCGSPCGRQEREVGKAEAAICVHVEGEGGAGRGRQKINRLSWRLVPLLPLPLPLPCLLAA